MKLKSFIASCILTLPLAVSQSGAAAAQATCPCFTAQVVNRTTCDDSIYSRTLQLGFEIFLYCFIEKLPDDELQSILDKEEALGSNSDFRMTDAYVSQDPRFST